MQQILNVKAYTYRYIYIPKKDRNQNWIFAIDCNFLFRSKRIMEKNGGNWE